MTPQLLTPQWEDYEMIDSGGFEKLERFGSCVLRRPEPQAIWLKSLPEDEWARLADATFRRQAARGDERGEWSYRAGMREQWFVGYRYREMALRMRLGMTSFKHVGIFPEQAENWNFIYDSVLRIQKTVPQSGSDGDTGSSVRALNLFAYTGGASLAACAAGAEVTHIDSVKQVVGWARENMEASGLDGIRWIVDDAMKFVRREVKRGRRYHGIILDPPAYGRGPDGEKWVLEEQFSELLGLCAQLLAPQAFIVLNLYSMGFSSLLAKGAANQLLGPADEEQFGELYIPDRAGKSLPLGVFYRFFRETDKSTEPPRP